MAFLLSPGVSVRETDLTNIIPAVATSIGGYVGPFGWGPSDTLYTVSSESDLIDMFGRPISNYNVREWYTAANFLGYTNNLKVKRVLGMNAVKAAGIAAGQSFEAKYEGAIGSSLGIAIASETVDLTATPEVNYTITFSAEASDATIQLDPNASADFADIATGTNFNLGLIPGGFTVDGTGGADVTANDVSNDFATFLNMVSAGIATDNADGSVSISLTDLRANGLESIISNIFSSVSADFTTADPNVIGSLVATISADSDTAFLYGTEGDFTSYSSVLTSAPAVNEASVIVYDLSGEFTGTAGSILEVFEYVNIATPGSKTIDGSPNYVLDVLGVDGTSKYAAMTSWAPSVDNGFAVLNGGSNGDLVTDSELQLSWDLFKDAERFDVNILISGPVSKNTQAYIIDNIASVRKDCISVAAPIESAANSAASIVAHFSTFNSTSYGVFVSGWKRQYDRYNDAYITMPTDADVAGLMARTDRTNDAWWSPAGLNRGQISNVVSLTFNPTAADRDTLYKGRVNPIVTLPGQGTVLFGDKTSLSRPSAFDRINVRRLFIVLEKAVATAAKFQLFEFNDEFTRANFVAAVEPYLRDVRARRGITDFFVKCDGENNTAAIIDRNEFVADIYVKPARSINFIRLNFVAVRSGVNFSEIVGQ